MGPIETQIAFVLADDLVAGGEGDHLFELAAHADGIAVAEVGGDGGAEGRSLAHDAVRKWLKLITSRPWPARNAYKGPSSVKTR